MMKLVSILLSLVLLGAIVIGILLSRKYGTSTILYLLQSSPESVLTYSKDVFNYPTPTPSTHYEGGTLITTSLDQRPKESLPPISSIHYISLMSHSFQKLNNCGPVSASMAASTYGINFDQFFAADRLKGGASDKNVGPYELNAFLETQGLKVAYRLNGNAEIMEQFISRDIPVIVAQWLEKKDPAELVGHYRVMRGYDQNTKVFTTNDSFNGANYPITYSQFDEWWRAFGRTYLVVYKPEQESIIKDILQADWDQTINQEDAVKVAKSEIATIGDGYSYFNLGTAQTMLGEYREAAATYNVALTKTFPPLFLWYEFGPLEAYYQTGQYNLVFSMTDQLLKEAGEVEEAHYYRMLVYEKQGKLVEARIEQEKMLAANPRFISPF